MSPLRPPSIQEQKPQCRGVSWRWCFGRIRNSPTPYRSRGKPSCLASSQSNFELRPRRLRLLGRVRCALPQGLGGAFRATWRWPCAIVHGCGDLPVPRVAATASWEDLPIRSTSVLEHCALGLGPMSLTGTSNHTCRHQSRCRTTNRTPASTRRTNQMPAAAASAKLAVSERENCTHPFFQACRFSRSHATSERVRTARVGHR